MKRPLVAVVLAYVIGLLLAQMFHPPLAALFALSFFFLVAALVLSKLRSLCFWPLLVLVGWTNTASRTSIISPRDLRNVLGNEPALVTLRGTLAETPHFKIVVRNDQEQWRTAATVRVREVRLEDDFVPVEGEVLITTPNTLGENFFAGQPVEVTGVMARPPPPLAEGLFDYQKYLATREIFYQLRTQSTNDWTLLSPHQQRPPLTDRFLSWSKNTLALGLPAEDEPLRLLWAMTLGWRTAFTGDISEPFLRAGTMHMFAVDGLRIALLSGMIVTLLGVARISRAWCGAVAIPVIWFYTAATGWESSAIRASVMMTIILGGWALKRPVDLMNSLAAAAFILLLAEPNQLFEASFQLSFLVVLVIAMVLPKWNNFFDALLKTDPLLPRNLVPAWKQKGLRLARKFAAYCGLAFAAWLGSLPLAAKYFHLLSPVSTLANIFAVPLGTLALMANLGALICGHWLPWLTILFNHAAWFFMTAMTWVSVKSAELPGAFFYVPEPSWVTIILFYVIVIAAFSGWFKTLPRKAFGAAILLAIASVYFCQWEFSRDDVNVTILPVNGGHVIHVDADGRDNDWLINCGNENAANFTLKNYLRGQGVNSLPRLALVDASTRNCGGTVPLKELFSIGNLWTTGGKYRSNPYRAAVESFSPTQQKTFAIGETVGHWHILFPEMNKSFNKADDGATVLLGQFGQTRVLLLNELSRSGQDTLLTQSNDLRADIVIAGLPSDSEPLCDALIEAIQPKLMIVADSEMPATRRASATLRERLALTKIPVIYTRTVGAVKITLSKHGWDAQTMDGQKFATP